MNLLLKKIDNSANYKTVRAVFVCTHWLCSVTNNLLVFSINFKMADIAATGTGTNVIAGDDTTCAATSQQF